MQIQSSFGYIVVSVKLRYFRSKKASEELVIPTSQNPQIKSFIGHISHLLALHYFTAGFELRLSLKSPGGPPGSLGRNFPTLFWYSLYSGYFFADMSSVNHVDA